MDKEFCQLWLTCKDEKEASKVSKSLLDKKLIVCARQLSVQSDYLWKGKIDNSREILLMMESRTDLFEKIEAEIAKLHSYKTFVLAAVPINRVSKKAEEWWENELSGNER